MILLDTHAWIWWLAQPASLSAAARDAIGRAVDTGGAGGNAEGVAVSAISVWELAMLVQRGRLDLTMTPSHWLEECGRLPFLSFLPLDPQIALRAVSLAPAFHADPADRMIVATALVHGLTLVTKDDRIRGHGVVTTIW
jgi:PIN domain nuclease of toxin-antitoxin system